MQLSRFSQETNLGIHGVEGSEITKNTENALNEIRGENFSMLQKEFKCKGHLEPRICLTRKPLHYIVYKRTLKEVKKKKVSSLETSQQKP